MKLFKKANIDFFDRDEGFIAKKFEIDFNAFLSKNILYILFLTFLTIIYISNRFYAESVVRKTAKLENQIKELKSEQVDVTSELVELSKQSEVIIKINEKKLGLQKSTKAPLIISND